MCPEPDSFPQVLKEDDEIKQKQLAEWKKKLKSIIHHHPMEKFVDFSNQRIPWKIVVYVQEKQVSKTSPMFAPYHPGSPCFFYVDHVCHVDLYSKFYALKYKKNMLKTLFCNSYAHISLHSKITQNISQRQCIKIVD